MTRDINEELHQMAVKIVPFVSLNERIRDAHDWSLRKSRGLLRTCAMKLSCHLETKIFIFII